jgi:deoxyribonuclease V
MILAIDVHYRDEVAKAVGLLFRQWTDANPDQIIIQYISEVEGYVSGEFYKRELPCLLAVIAQLDELPDCIVIDGYVTLGENRKPGLGMHLYNALEHKVPVIGVAKNSYSGRNPEVSEVFRGDSGNPLFVTSTGIDVETASEHIASMHGEHRFPTLLGLLDRHTKED